MKRKIFIGFIILTTGLVAGGLWFLGTALAYHAVLLPGFLAHALCIWSGVCRRTGLALLLVSLVSRDQRNDLASE